MLQTGEPLFIQNVNKETPVENYPVHRDTGSLLLVPMRARGNPLGILVLENIKSHAYKTLDVSMAMNFAGHASLAIENAQLFQEINLLAITDDLTGLYNRRHFYELGEQEFKRARRYRIPLSLIMMDIDHFKSINDAFGHTTGDKVLQAIARKCQDNLRSIDIPCRYGGEEFAFLLPETNPANAIAIAERIRVAIGSSPMPLPQGSVTITASFGVSTLEEGLLDFDQMVVKADTNLYEAKRRGRNMVVANGET